MIEPWHHEIARQRHRDLLVGAERHRLDRIVRVGKTSRRTAFYRLKLLVGWVFRTSSSFAQAFRSTWRLH